MIDVGKKYVESFWFHLTTENYEALEDMVADNVSATIADAQGDKHTYEGRASFMEQIKAINAMAVDTIANGKAYISSDHDAHTGYRVVELKFCRQYRNLVGEEVYAEGRQRFTLFMDSTKWLLSNYLVNDYSETVLAEGVFVVTPQSERTGPTAAQATMQGRGWYCVVS